MNQRNDRTAGGSGVQMLLLDASGRVLAVHGSGLLDPEQTPVELNGLLVPGASGTLPLRFGGDGALALEGRAWRGHLRSGESVTLEFADFESQAKGPTPWLLARLSPAAESACEPSPLHPDLLHLAEALSTIKDGALITNLEGVILWANASAGRISGRDPAVLVGQRPSVFKSGRHAPVFYERMWSELVARGRWHGEVWNRNADGVEYPQWLAINLIRSPDDTPLGYLGVFSDIADLKAQEYELQRLAHHDLLTALPNRTLLKDRLGHALSRARRDRHGVGVLFIDLDRFKPVNDAHGHDFGDRVLREIADRMTRRLRGQDTVSRLGGDEFLVVLAPMHSPESAARVATDLIACIGEPLRLDDQREVTVGASVGISVHPTDADDVDGLIQCADIAMYSAKQAGGNTFRFYHPDLGHAVERRTQLEEDLRAAINRNQIEVHYQPIFSFKSGAVQALEAMVRWAHPREGPLMPDAFLPIADRVDLIRPLGARIRRLAFEDIHGLQTGDGPELGLTLNLSRREVADPETVAALIDLSEQRAFPLHRLYIDIREDTLIGPDTSVHDNLRTLADHGVRIMLDDFGMGHSALADLVHLPLHGLKVDRRIVQQLPDAEEAHLVCRIARDVASRLGLLACAEGVETQAQAEILHGLGFDVWQGYLGLAPLPPRRLQVADEFRRGVDTSPRLKLTVPPRDVR